MPYIFDALLIIVFLFLTLWGLWRGFLKTVLSFGRLWISLQLTMLLGTPFSTWLRHLFASAGGSASPQKENLLFKLIGYLLLFALIFAALSLVIHVAGILVKLPILKQIDKLLGLLLGMVCGAAAAVFIAAVLCLILYLSDRPEIYEASVILRFIGRLPPIRSLIGA